MTCGASPTFAWPLVLSVVVVWWFGGGGGGGDGGGGSGGGGEMSSNQVSEHLCKPWISANHVFFN